MDNKERAKKIANVLFLGCSQECKLDPSFKEIEWITSQLDEALDNALMNRTQCFDAGFNAAREKAAGIVDDHNGCVDVKCLSESNCGATISYQIRAMESDK